MAGKRHPYTGGAWQVGGIRSQRPAVSPATRRALLLGYIEHAKQRLSEGATVYEGMLREYRAELIAVSLELAAERRAGQTVPPVAKAA